MAEVICPENVLINIELSELLPKCLEMKEKGLRLGQACAAYINDKYELSYSFADDTTYELFTLRVVIDRDTVVPSISQIIPAAVFYENEMSELFGVKIEFIDLDYHHKLYRLKEGMEAPMVEHETVPWEEK